MRLVAAIQGRRKRLMVLVWKCSGKIVQLLEGIRRIDPLIGRMIFWCLVVGVTLGASLRFHVAFPADKLFQLFAPKVPFLGLIITAATFQYRTWRELADRDEKRITDLRWIQFERQVDELRAQVAAGAASAQMLSQLQAWEGSLKTWKMHNAEVSRDMLVGTLPHSVALLGNFLFIGVCLLLSSAGDSVVFLMGRDIQWLREVSSSLFIVVVLPFLESAVRYGRSLYWETRNDRQWFQAQYEKAMREIQ